MNTTTAPTTKGVAFLDAHPELISGAHTVRADRFDSVGIQGNAEDMADAVAAFRELDTTVDVHAAWHQDSDGNTYDRVVGLVDGITVELVLVTQAVQS